MRFKKLVWVVLGVALLALPVAARQQIKNGDVATTAAIALSKLASVTASRALYSDASGVINPSTVTATELGYLSGVTSAIQTQLNTKAPTASPTFTGQAAFALGSSGAPSIVPTGSTTTGWWFPSTSSIAASIAGTEYWRLNSSGQVQVGASSSAPDADNTMHIKCNNDNLGACLEIEGTGSGANRTYNLLVRANGDSFFYNQGAGEQAWGTLVGGAVFYVGPSPAGANVFRSAIGGTDTTTSVTDWTTLTARRPGLAIRNTNSTVGNLEQIGFFNSNDAFIGGISGVNDNHSATASATGHLSVAVRKAGTVAEVAQFHKDRILFPVAPMAAKGVVTADATGEISSNTMTNGQLLIGSTGANPVVASLTAGAGITITPGAGSIAISTAGSPAATQVTKTSNYTTVSTDNTVLVDASGGALTITLESAAGIGGTQHFIKKYVSTGNLVTVQPQGGQTIDGDTEMVLAGMRSGIVVESDGTNWVVRSAY